MKKDIIFKNQILVCVLILTVFFVGGCKKNLSENLLPDNISSVDISNNTINSDRLDNELYPHPDNKDLSRFSRAVPLDELVVWIKPGRTQAEFNTWLDTAIRKKASGQTLSITNACEGCDRTLKLLKGTAVATYIQGATAQGGKDSPPKVPNSGEDGPIFQVLNFKNSITTPRMSRNKDVVQVPAITYTSSKVVRVAVLDTGLDTAGLKKYLLKTGVVNCIPQSEFGWNFIDHNNNYRDNDPVKHGTTVTQFIIDQVNQYKTNPIEIVPVKTHDGNGMSDLYTILCAFAYAQKMGANIVNASFGFYSPRLELISRYPVDPNIRLLKEYIEYYLTKKNILLVTAAGNKDDVNERNAFYLHQLVRPALAYPTDPRDLDQVSFYPASLARDKAFSNVISATTTYNETVSSHQNFSESVVDIGVDADAKLLDAVSGENMYVFNNPRMPRGETVTGSSFATPIVTGKLCANYDKFSEILTPGFDKAIIWRKLGSAIVQRSSVLSVNSIKNGNIMKK